MAEQRTFVFAVTFIIIFSALVVTIPSDFQGAGGEPNEIGAVNPNLVTDFSDSETYTKSDFVLSGGLLGYWYPAPLGGYEFLSSFIADAFYLGAKSKFFGIWFGAISSVQFIYENGTTDYYGLSFADIANVAVDGIATFNLVFQTEGTSAGTFLFYWNTTTYANDPSDAWDDDELYLLHGIGFTADTNVVSLLLSLLFLQLPDCPVLINVLIATPVWASIIYLIWFIIKETLPFV